MTEEEEKKEEQFFKAKPREDSMIGLRPPPMSTTAKVAAGVLIAVLLAGIGYWQLTAKEGTLWVMNPGPGSVEVQVSGKTETLEQAKVLAVRVATGEAVPVTVKRGAQETKTNVPIKDDAKQITVLDLGEGAYVVLDVSPLYGEGDAPEAYPLKHTSSAGSIHQLPFPALKLIGPGHPLPDKGSWELKAFGSGKDLEIYKVFRVDGHRLEDQQKLLKSLHEGLRSGNAQSYENMSVPLVKTSTARIPHAGS